MLLKAPGSDARELAFAEWRAKLPFWNIEADRFRAAAIAARDTGSVPAGLADDIEHVIGQVRATLQHCEALVDAALPGDQQLALLMTAAADFEALLESLHGSLERVADLGGSAPRARGPVTIVRRPAPAALPLR